MKAILVHVFFDHRDLEGVRILGTNHIIYKKNVSNEDWETFLKIIENQKKDKED